MRRRHITIDELPPEHKQPLLEAQTMSRMFFGDDEVTVTYDHYTVVVTDKRRSYPGSQKWFTRTYYHGQDALNYMKKLCATAHATLDDGEYLTTEEKNQIKTLNAECKRIRRIANTASIRSYGKKGRLMLGGHRTPYHVHFPEIDGGSTIRRYSTLERARTAIEKYHACCISRKDYNGIVRVNQALLRKRQFGRIKCFQHLGNLPTFKYKNEEFATFADAEKATEIDLLTGPDWVGDNFRAPEMRRS